MVKISRQLRKLLEDTEILLHLSALFLVSLVIIIASEISNLSFFPILLFPPIASAAFIVSYDPESEFSNPKNIIFGLTLGALSGWISLEILGFEVPAYILSIFLSGILTWISSTENPSAYSAAVLAIFSRESILYVIAIFLSSVLLGFVSYIWRKFYEGRANYLYESTKEECILSPYSPIYTDIAGHIAKKHGKGGEVVILESGEVSKEKIKEIEKTAKDLEEKFKIRTEISIIEEKTPKSVLDVAERYSCDSIISPWKDMESTQKLFGGKCDVLAIHGLDKTKNRRWEDSLVPVREENELSHLMVEIASRITDTVGVLKIIDNSKELRKAEKELEELIDGFQGNFETRVRKKTDTIEKSIKKLSKGYDILIIGASTDRTTVSRIISTPLMNKLIEEMDIPIIIVHSAKASRPSIIPTPKKIRTIFRRKKQKPSKKEKHNI